MCVLCSIAKVRVDTSRTRLYSCVIYFFYLEIIFPSCVHRQCVCPERVIARVWFIYTEIFWRYIYTSISTLVSFVVTFSAAPTKYSVLFCVWENLAFFAKKKEEKWRLHNCTHSKRNWCILPVFYSTACPVQCCVCSSALYFVNNNKRPTTVSKSIRQPDQHYFKDIIHFMNWVYIKGCQTVGIRSILHSSARNVLPGTFFFVLFNVPRWLTILWTVGWFLSLFAVVLLSVYPCAVQRI